VQIKTRPAAADVKLATKHSRDRDEDQTAIDAELGKTVAAYVKAGGDKVSEDKRPRVAFAVAPDDKASLKGLIRRAATLHKVAPVFFEDTADDATGEIVVTLTVGPPPAKKH
jgi:hypothetical protein